MPDLRIYLLGQFRVLVDGEPVDERQWSRKKSKALLKILCIQPSRQIQREQLIDLLWPDTEPDLAANNLHKALHAARRALEPNLAAGQPSQFLHSQDALIVLRPSGMLWIDSVEFEAAAAEAVKSRNLEGLEKAQALYGGDLLEEDRYEDWVSLRREQLRLMGHRVLDRLAETYEQHGLADKALETSQLLVTRSPAHEPAHRRIMRLYAESGQRHLALNQFKVCSDALRRELDAAPEAATVELHQAIVDGGVMASDRRAPAALQRSVASKGRKKTLAAIAAAILAFILLVPFFVFRSRRAARREVESLAVLPLTAPGQAEDIALVGDGLTENMINSLSSVTGIRVMARSTVYRYRDRASDPVSVGKQLHVDAVLTGTVIQRGQQFFVTVELVNVEDGSRLWGRQYIVPATDLTRLQTGLGADVAASLHRKAPSDQGRSTSDPQAYRFYLEARYFLNKRTSDGYRKAIVYLDKALERDPAYALAYAGLADTYGLLGFDSAPSLKYFAKARAAAVRALELDGGLAEAHTSLAMVHALYDWDWAGAESEFRRALELNPGYSTAHHWYGVHLGAMGRFQDARSELAKALELDPFSPIINTNLAYPDLYQREYVKAEAQYRKALELDANFPVALEDLAALHWLRGDRPASLHESVLRLRSSGDSELGSQIEDRFRTGGYPAAIKFWVGALESRARQLYIPPMSIAALYIRLGDRDNAMRWVQRAFQEHSAELVYAAVDPQYSELWRDPRFAAILSQAGLPAAIH